MFKVIVAGSRGFNSYAYMEEALDQQIMEAMEELDVIDDIEIVSGGAKGADKLGERYAKERGYSLKVFPADWNKFGKSAGYKRNEQMAEYADMAIVFWDGESKGTKHMIDIADEKEMYLAINEYDESDLLAYGVEKEVEENKNNNKNMEVVNMNNNTMNNNKVVNTFVIVNRAGKAIVMNGKTNKYNTATDENNSSTMASMKLLSKLVSKLERTENVLNIVLIPRNLGGILKLNEVDKWIANGNKTDNGTQLSDEYVELVKYVNDMRKYLGSNNLILKVQGGRLINKEEKVMINNAWLTMDKFEKKAPRVKPQGEKPATPVALKDIKDIEF